MGQDHKGFHDPQEDDSQTTQVQGVQEKILRVRA
jgi:hypothetical protein